MCATPTHAVVTANPPQYETIERFDMDSMRVRLFPDFDSAHTWAIENPHYITEVVAIEAAV